jgi:hypothetical protein
MKSVRPPNLVWRNQLQSSAVFKNTIPMMCFPLVVLHMIWSGFLSTTCFHVLSLYYNTRSLVCQAVTSWCDRVFYSIIPKSSVSGE